MKGAVKHNISDFKDYLKSNDIYMEENIDENDGSVHFSVGLETEAGAKIQLIGFPKRTSYGGYILLQCCSRA